MTSLFVPGLVVLVVFYILIFGIGIWAAWKRRAKGHELERQSELMTVGRRDIGLIFGVFTMTATWVGGGYINGLAEIVYTPGYGLIWNLSPLAFIILFTIAGSFYAKKMREKKYVTMLDPLQEKFGDRMGGLLCIPAVMGDVFWSAAILKALGGTLSVILGMDITSSVIISALIAISYTLLGGIYSVAYTDVVQLILIFIGMWISVGFAFVHPAVSNIASTAVNGTNWFGSWKSEEAGLWTDELLLLTFGGIPFQVYFQRVLASETARKAQILSYIAGFMTFFMSIPPILIGAIAASTDWNKTEYIGIPYDNDQASFIFPIVMRYLTPVAVAVIGLAAFASAVMSSIDSSLLSAASMFSRNVYKLTFRPKAGNKELVWIARFSIFLFGALAAFFSLIIQSVFVLWYFSIDLIYVVLFPQLTSVLFLDPNIYGSIPAYFIGILLRFGGGDIYMGLKPFIHYPGALNFPLKTFAMIISFITLMAFSWMARYLFSNGIIPERFDFLKSNLARKRRNVNFKQREVVNLSSCQEVQLQEE